MKKRLLFENVSGNQFKLASTETHPKSGIIREGLKKIFASANGQSLSYTYISNIGMGYIKDVGEARKVSLQEAAEIANEYGYVNDDQNSKFVKEQEKQPSTFTDSSSESVDPSFLTPEALRTAQSIKEKESELKMVFAKEPAVFDELMRITAKILHVHGK
jgi:hypothetical protein